MKVLYKHRLVLIGAIALFAMLWITCGISQARGPVPTETPMPTATPTPIPEGWTPDDTYQPTSGEQVRLIWKKLYADPESGYAGYEADDWWNPKEAILVLTKDADREAILKEWPDDVKLSMIDAKYTFNELDAVRREIFAERYYRFGEDSEEHIVIGADINQRENYVKVCIDRRTSKKIQEKVIADLFERYGDCIRIDASMSSEELEELEASTAVDDLTLANSANKEFYNYKPDGSLLTFTDYMSNRGSDKAASRGATLAIAAGLGAAILALAYVLRRQNGRVAVLADGRQSVRGTYSDAEIEALAKCAGGDVSEEGRMRIFEAYERETGKTPR
jgi:hypothetical protein